MNDNQKPFILSLISSIIMFSAVYALLLIFGWILNGEFRLIWMFNTSHATGRIAIAAFLIGIPALAAFLHSNVNGSDIDEESDRPFAKDYRLEHLQQQILELRNMISLYQDHINDITDKNK